MEEENTSKEDIAINENMKNNIVFDKVVEDKLYVSINEKEIQRLNTENYEMGSPRERENENKINELIENNSK